MAILTIVPSDMGSDRCKLIPPDSCQHLRALFTLLCCRCVVLRLPPRVAPGTPLQKILPAAMGHFGSYSSASTSSLWRFTLLTFSTTVCSLVANSRRSETFGSYTLRLMQLPGTWLYMPTYHMHTWTFACRVWAFTGTELIRWGIGSGGRLLWRKQADHPVRFQQKLIL